MIKLGLNTTPTKSGHKTRGVGFYTQNLLTGLRKIKEIKIFEFDKLSDLNDVDIVHYPVVDLFKANLSLKKRFPTVVTIHDVIPLVFPQHYPPGIMGKIKNIWQKISLINVNGVITVSECSKKDIAMFLHINQNKISVIPLAPAKQFRIIKDQNTLRGAVKKYKLPEKFALFIGSVNWNKNLVGLTQAAIDLDLNLILVGKDFENKDDLNHPERKSYQEFLKRFSTNPLIHNLGFIPDRDLAAIYNLALVTLLPSFYEGFGLPILESQACGTAVVTSNLSSMVEIAGNGAILVNPYSVEEIKQAIKKISKDDDFRKNLVNEGYKNAQRYSWEKTTQKTLEIYKKIIDKND